MGYLGHPPDFVLSQLNATVDDLIRKTPGARDRLANSFSGSNRSACRSSLLTLSIQLICKPELKYVPLEETKALIHMSPRTIPVTPPMRPGPAKGLQSAFAWGLPPI